MAMIEGAGVALAVQAVGDGPAVLLVHDVASDAAALSNLSEVLVAAGRRVIAYDRRGYGGSGAPEPYTGTTVAEQSRDALAVLQGLDAGGAVVVGPGFGGLVALELAIHEPAMVGAVVAADPPALGFVPEATEGLSAQRDALEAAMHEGGPAAGIAAWLGERAATPDGHRALDAVLGFYADYAGLASFEATRAQLRAIGCPVALVTGPETTAVVGAATEALAALIADVTRRDDGDVAAAALAAGRP